MNTRLKLGPELELLVLDNKGRLVNKGSDILSQNKNPYIYPEFVESMVEVGCKPSDDLREIERSLSDNLADLVDLAGKNDCLVVPLTTLRTSVDPEIRDVNYFKAQQDIFGKGNYEFAKHSTAAHVHIDLEDDQKGILRQFLLGTAIDPSFVFMSSSPYYQGKNTIKDIRVVKYRHEVYKRFPDLGSLIPYSSSMEELQDHFQKNYLWLKEEIGKLSYDVGKTKLINEYSAYWGNPRITYTDNKKTIEIRSPDANNTPNFMAYMALLKGLFNFIGHNDVDLNVEEKPHYFQLDNKCGKTMLTIPPFEELKQIEVIGCYKGLESSKVRDYCANMLEISSKGLLDDELYFLEPFREMLDKRKNYSDDLKSFAKSGNYLKDNMLTEKGACSLRLKAYDDLMYGLDNVLN